MIAALVILLAVMAFYVGFCVGKQHPSIVRDDAAALERIVANFRADFADAWEAMKLGPLVHGIESMIAKLKG